MSDLLTTPSITEQLNEIYYRWEVWHKNKLPQDQATYYHDTLLRKGRILCAVDAGRVLGYVESWAIDFSQFGRIICQEPFIATVENVNDGNLAYVANTFIYPEHRKGWVVKFLCDEFFKQNGHCTHFCGEARRKNCAPVKVFKREKIKAYLKHLEV